MNINEMFQTSKENWNSEVTAAKLEYPDESVIRFLAKHKKSGGRVMDFGCGAGRHSVLMAKFGYEVTAVDYNQECLDIAADRLKKHTQNFRIIMNSDASIDVDNAYFDYIVSWGTLFLNGEEDIHRYLCELNRTLKLGGELFADWRTLKDYLYGRGKEVGKNLFYLDETSGRPGLLYYFASLDSLKKLYEDSGFSIINAETYEFTQNNGKDLNSWLHITARKEKEAK